jgi:hypothetical protein
MGFQSWIAPLSLCGICRKFERQKLAEKGSAKPILQHRRAASAPGSCGYSGENMGKVTALTPREVVRQDVEAIAAIYRNLGAPTAEKMVTRALGELALTMARLAETVRAQNLRDMADHLVRLSRLADDLGLVSLAEVARDSRLCLERADSTGFSAVWARLVRVAERSLSPHPGMADLSG